MENESSTGDWLRDLAHLVDKKDKLIRKQQEYITQLTQHRLVVGWMHPQTKRIISDSIKMIAKQQAAHHLNDPEKIHLDDLDKLQHTVPLFAEIDPNERGWREQCDAQQ
jgi:hypothetical protein